LGGSGPPINTPLFHDLTDAYTSPWHWVNRNFAPVLMKEPGQTLPFAAVTFRGLLMCNE